MKIYRCLRVPGSANIHETAKEESGVEMSKEIGEGIVEVTLMREIEDEVESLMVKRDKIRMTENINMETMLMILVIRKGLGGATQATDINVAGGVALWKIM